MVAIPSLVSWPRREIGASLISISGVVLMGAFIYHLILMETSLGLLGLEGGSVLLAAGIVYAGVAVHRSSYGEEGVRVISEFFVTGMFVALVLVAAMAKIYFPLHGYDLPYEFVIYSRGAAGGGVVGLLIGRYEANRREAQRRLELAVETGDAGIWDWDMQNETVLWEDSIETMLGLEAGSFAGTYEAFVDRIHPEDRSAIEECIEHAITERTDFEKEFRIRHDSGEYIWVLARAQLIMNAAGRPERMIGVAIDISDRIDYVQQLEVLDRVLRHNLRNDMTTIQGFAEVIQDEVSGVTSETETIIETGQQLMESIDKEREIVEFLSERPEKEELDIVDVCQGVVADKRDSYPNADITLNHPDTAPVAATSKIARSIEELVENALIHSNQESPEISLSVESGDETASIEIADNGPGIPDKEVSVLTRDHEIDPLYHGSGLGLWLVKWVVKFSGGTIRFEENDPRGSKITIELDQVDANTSM